MNEIFNRAKRFVDDLAKELPSRVDKAIGEVDTLRWSSEYSQTETYARGSIVRYRNQLWVALQEVRNEDPASSKSWDFAMEVASFGSASGFIKRGFIEQDTPSVLIVLFNGVPTGTFNLGVTYTVNGGAPQTFTGAILSTEYAPQGVEYTVSPAFVDGDVVEWIYDDTIGDIQVNDEPLPSIELSVDNRIDTTPPQVTTSSVSVAGTVLTINFDENVENNSGFTLTVNAVATEIVYASATPRSITYSISTTVLQDDPVLLTYEQGDIQDTVGNLLIPFSDLPVDNNSGQSPPVTGPITTMSVFGVSVEGFDSQQFTMFSPYNRVATIRNSTRFSI